MKNLSRGAWIAIAAVVAVPATVAIAKSFEHRGGWNQMSPEARARLAEGRLAMAKTALKLTPDQEKLWAPLEANVRDTMKAMDAKRAEMKTMFEQRKNDRAEGRDVKRPDMVERFEKMSQMMSERAERMKGFVAAFKPLYATLSDEQKEVLRPLMRELAPGMGRGGHGGKRWAHGGGWGPGGRKHHGEHGGWGRHRGGPDGEGRGPGMGGPGMGPGMGGGMGGGLGGMQGTPPAQQYAPDVDTDNDAGPAEQDM